MSGWMTFHAHQVLVRKLFEELQRPPMRGHHSVTLSQLERADREAWNRLSRVTNGNIMPDGRGNLPADAALRSIVDEPQFNYLLMQLPGRGKSPIAKRERSHSEPRSRPNPKRRKPAQGRGQSSQQSKGSGKGPRRGPTMPQELRNMASKTPQGSNICFAFNMASGCSNGETCSRGVHVCCKPGCFKKRPLTQCPGT